MIPEGIVEEVRARADIVEVIGEHVPLKRAGKDYRGLCPFHQERTPSFYVVPAKGFYNCFGCGASGDVFSFYMEHLGLGFQDAVRHLAERVGVQIPERSSGAAGEEEHAALYEAVAFAADFYAGRLRGEEGLRAREYLARRGIEDEAVERFRLGYAPAGWTALRDAASELGIPDEVLIEAGLIRTSDRGGDPYDRFRDRLIFPITGAGGRVIAFGGRLLGAAREGAPKYLNSPETPIYHKGRTLYGLTWARSAIRREAAVLVVEGYMDYVSLAARGIENVVAGLGTAMTTEQAALIARYTRRAFLVYDSDPAGLRATFRTADALLAAGVHPLVVTLPPGEDPDSIVRRGGAEALAPYLDAAVDVLDRKLQILEARGYFSGIEGTRKALDGLLPTLRAASDPALRDIYVTRVAERTGVRRETLEAELHEGRGVPARSIAASRARLERRAAPGRGSGRPGRARPAAERMLLLLLLRDEARIAPAAEALDPEMLTDPHWRELFRELVRVGGLQGRAPTVLELSDGARTELEELLGDREELSDGDRIFREVVAEIRARPLLERIERLQAALDAGEGDPEVIFRERAEVTNELRALGSELDTLGYRLTRRFRRYLGS